MALVRQKVTLLNLKDMHYWQKMITKSPAVAKVGRPYRLYPKTNVRLLVAVRKRFFRVTAVRTRYSDAAISNATL